VKLNNHRGDKGRGNKLKSLIEEKKKSGKKDSAPSPNDFECAREFRRRGKTRDAGYPSPGKNTLYQEGQGGGGSMLKSGDADERGKGESEQRWTGDSEKEERWGKKRGLLHHLVLQIHAL